MASSRDDFIIAIRSAFLKKSTKQKFSLSTLVFLSIFTIILSNFDFKVIKYFKIGINEIVYRTSFLVSIPENFVKKSYENIFEYSLFYKDYKNIKDELAEIKSTNISQEIIKNENKELKRLLDDYVSSSKKILAKVILDHNSPFLKTLVINKGSKDYIKLGTNIYDQYYLVGKVIEVNYKTSRILLLSDLNSNVPVTILPGNIQAIVSGGGDNFGEIKYVKDGIIDQLVDDSIIYTSGTSALFKSGVPVGRLDVIQGEKNKKFFVNFYSDFSQLKYVLAEIEEQNFVKKDQTQIVEEANKVDINANTVKQNILEDEIKIFKKSNDKFLQENENLKNEISDLKKIITNNEIKILSQNEILKQNDIDTDELEFLKMNLIYSSKCQKSFFKKGYLVGTQEYRDCILNRGKKND